jgi:hypothetical protein
MSLIRLRTAALLLAAGIGVSACAYGDGYGYGYGGLSAGYGGYCDPYWDDCYYGGGGYGAYDPWYGWYGDYYYPGIGIYVFDRSGRRYRWNDDHRRYWEGRRQHWGDRNWGDRRWERWDGYRGDRNRDWRRDGRSGTTGWRDRSNRQEWNENPQSFRREGMRVRGAEPGMRTETRTESRTRTEGARQRGEWRGRSEGRGGNWRGRREQN